MHEDNISQLSNLTKLYSNHDLEIVGVHIDIETLVAWCVKDHGQGIISAYVDWWSTSFGGQMLS